MWVKGSDGFRMDGFRINGFASIGFGDLRVLWYITGFRVLIV